MRQSSKDARLKPVIDAERRASGFQEAARCTLLQLFLAVTGLSAITPPPPNRNHLLVETIVFGNFILEYSFILLDTNSGETLHEFSHRQIV
jgi:hypothetical protein